MSTNLTLYVVGKEQLGEGYREYYLSKGQFIDSLLAALDNYPTHYELGQEHLLDHLLIVDDTWAYGGIEGLILFEFLKGLFSLMGYASYDSLSRLYEYHDYYSVTLQEEHILMIENLLNKLNIEKGLYANKQEILDWLKAHLEQKIFALAE